jgi:WD40 repeat protein
LLDEATAGESLTKTGEVVGTPSYMAPEQARTGGPPVGPPADVYALGAVLYELLTGRPPFAATTPLDTLLRVVHEEPVSVTRLCPSVPRDLATVTMKCLEKEPARRYATAGALADDLARFREGRSVQARPVGRAGRAWKWCRRNPAVAGLLAALTLVIAAGFAATLWQMLKAQASAAAEGQARADADREKSRAIQGEQEAKTLRRQAERAAALSLLDNGVTRCRQGDVTVGLLLLAQSLEKAEHARADDLQHAIRCNLAAWARHVVPTTASPRHGSSLLSIAWAPNGRTVATAPMGNAWGKPGPAEVRLWDAATWKPIGKALSHPQPVWALAFSPDGKKLLTGSGSLEGTQGEARLWDLASGQTARHGRLPHAARVHAVAFSRDGKTVLTGCWDGTARLWDAATGLPVGKPLQHPVVVKSVAFSPDGQTVLTGGGDPFARLWDVARSKLIGTLPHPAHVWAVAFGPDGRRMLTGCADHTAHLWLWQVEKSSVQRLGPPMMAHYPISAVAFHPTKPLLATAAGAHDLRSVGRGEAQLWDATTTKPVGPPLTEGGVVQAVAFSPDGRRLLTAMKDGRARLADVSRLSPLALSIQHAPGVRWVRHSPDGKSLLTVAAEDGRVSLGKMRLWDAITGKAAGAPLPAHPADWNGTTFRVFFSPDGKALVNVLPDRSVHLRDAATGSLLGPPLPKKPAIGHLVVFRPDGKQYAVLSDGAVLVWDTATNKQIGPPLQHAGGITAVAFHPDGKALLTAGGDGTTCVWDLGTRRRIGEPVRHALAIRTLAFSPDGRTYLTADRENTVRRWETRTGRPLGPALRDPKTNPRENYFAVRVTPDGKYVVADSKEALRLWDAATGRLISTFPNLGTAWSSDGKMLAVISGNPLEQEVEGAVRLGDVGRRQLRGLPTVTNDASLDFHPDGRILATGGEQAAGLWDVATGKPIGPPLNHPSALLAVNFSPDGRRLATCCGDDTARLWEVPRPVSGGTERVKRWVEVLTGNELDEAGDARPLGGPELERRRQRNADKK